MGDEADEEIHRRSSLFHIRTHRLGRNGHQVVPQRLRVETVAIVSVRFECSQTVAETGRLNVRLVIREEHAALEIQLLSDEVDIRTRLQTFQRSKLSNLTGPEPQAKVARQRVPLQQAIHRERAIRKDCRKRDHKECQDDTERKCTRRGGPDHLSKRKRSIDLWKHEEAEQTDGHCRRQGPRENKLRKHAGNRVEELHRRRRGLSLSSALLLLRFLRLRLRLRHDGWASGAPTHALNPRPSVAISEVRARFRYHDDSSGRRGRYGEWRNGLDVTPGAAGSTVTSLKNSVKRSLPKE